MIPHSTFYIFRICAISRFNENTMRYHWHYDDVDPIAQEKPCVLICQTRYRLTLFVRQILLMTMPYRRSTEKPCCCRRVMIVMCVEMQKRGAGNKCTDAKKPQHFC